MSLITVLFSLVLVVACAHANQQHYFLPAVKQQTGKPVKHGNTWTSPNHPSGPVIMGMGGTIRQEDKEKPICEQFVLSYKQVRRTTLYLQRQLAPAEAEYQRCKKCLLCFSCNEPRKEALMKSATKCLDKYGFSRCAVAVSLLGRDNDISYTCRFYFKESRIGNCYALEYLTLNGLKGGENNDKLVFSKEKGQYDKKPFQCRAGKRAGLPDLKNQDVCRTKFRVSPQQISAVARCAFPAFAAASNQYSACIARSTTNILAINQCYIWYTYQTSIAYINCINPHGSAAVAVASLAIGQNAMSCPVLRRDSYVGPCKAPDYVNLVNLDLVQVKAGSLNVMLSGACNYKK